MSTDIKHTQEAISHILNFIKKEPSFASTAIKYKVDLSKTLTLSQSVYANTCTLGSDLSSLFTTWDQLTADKTDDEAEVLIKILLVEIDNSEEELKKLKAVSSSLNESVNSAESALKNVASNIHNQITAEKKQMENLQVDIKNTADEINKINKELSGSSGFLEGFLTGISAGIYSGLRDKLSQAKSLRNTYANQYAQIQRTFSQTQYDEKTISQIDFELQLVSDLYSSVVSLENTLQALSVLAKSTEHDGSRIYRTENGKVAAFYRERFNKDMTQLLEWKNVFPV